MQGEAKVRQEYEAHVQQLELDRDRQHYQARSLMEVRARTKAPCKLPPQATRRPSMDGVWDFVFRRTDVLHLKLQSMNSVEVYCFAQPVRCSET